MEVISPRLCSEVIDKNGRGYGQKSWRLLLRGYNLEVIEKNRQNFGHWYEVMVEVMATDVRLNSTITC